MVVANLAVAEQIGELHVHCTYGCRPTNKVIQSDLANQNSLLPTIVYEVDPGGCSVTVKLNERRYEINTSAM